MFSLATFVPLLLAPAALVSAASLPVEHFADLELRGDDPSQAFNGNTSLYACQNSWSADTLKLTCPTYPASDYVMVSTIKLDVCVNNDGGALTFDASGGYTGSCTDCALDSVGWNLECVCKTGLPVPNDWSTTKLALDGTHGQSVGLRIHDSGLVQCFSRCYSSPTAQAEEGDVANAMGSA